MMKTRSPGLRHRKLGQNWKNDQELALYQSPSGLIRSLKEGFRVRDLCCGTGLAIVLALASRPCVAAQQSRTSGTFVLHKFAKAIGTETYSTETKDDTYVLTSHFVFTDRGSKVLLETTFTADIQDMTPRSYSARGKSSRFFDLDDELTVDGDSVFISRRGKKQTQTATPRCRSR